MPFLLLLILLSGCGKVDAPRTYTVTVGDVTIVGELKPAAKYTAEEAKKYMELVLSL